VKEWIANSKQYAENAPIFLVGCKSDLEEERISFETMSNFAHENDLLIIETSAKENVNVKETFNMITCIVCDLPNPIQKPAKSARKV